MDTHHAPVKWHATHRKGEAVITSEPLHKARAEWVKHAVEFALHPPGHHGAHAEPMEAHDVDLAKQLHSAVHLRHAGHDWVVTITNTEVAFFEEQMGVKVSTAKEHGHGERRR